MRQSSLVILFVTVAFVIFTPLTGAFPFVHRSILRRCFGSLCGTCGSGLFLFGSCNGNPTDQSSGSPDETRSANIILQNNNAVRIGGQSTEPFGAEYGVHNDNENSQVESSGGDTESGIPINSGSSQAQKRGFHVYNIPGKDGSGSIVEMDDDNEEYISGTRVMESHPSGQETLPEESSIPTESGSTFEDSPNILAGTNQPSPADISGSSSPTETDVATATDSLAASPTDAGESNSQQKRCFGGECFSVCESCLEKSHERPNEVKVQTIVVNNINKVEVTVSAAVAPVTNIETLTMEATEILSVTEAVPTTVFDTATESFPLTIMNTMTQVSIVTETTPIFVSAPAAPIAIVMEAHEIPAAPVCNECEEAAGVAMSPAEPIPVQASPVDDIVTEPTPIDASQVNETPVGISDVQIPFESTPAQVPDAEESPSCVFDGNACPAAQ